MTIKIIDIAGLKKSGKTTVLTKIVEGLSSRGYKVGTLKKIHISDFTIDHPGKDTFRHKQAGAEFVISNAPEEIALIQRQSEPKRLSEIISMIPKDTDFLICEELNEVRDDIAYIITLTSPDRYDETMHVRSIGKNILAISGVIANSISDKENNRYPIINATTEEGKRQLIELILKYFSSN